MNCALTRARSLTYHGIVASCCAVRAAGGRVLHGARLRLSRRHVLPRALALGSAPVIGWAVFSAATLPILTPIGFSTALRSSSSARFVLWQCRACWRYGGKRPMPRRRYRYGAYAAAASSLSFPRPRILPKISADGVHLADPDLRSCENRDHRRDGAARTAAGQSGLRRFRRGGRLAYYYLWHFSAAELALALHVKRLGSRYRAHLVYRFRIADFDDGHRRLAQQAVRRGVFGCCSRRRGVAARHAELDLRFLRADAVHGIADRVCRLAVSVGMGAAASDVGVVRGRGDAAARPLRATAKPCAAFDAGFNRGRRFRKLDLCRRRDIRDRGLGLRAHPVRRRATQAADPLRSGPGDGGAYWPPVLPRRSSAINWQRSPRAATAIRSSSSPLRRCLATCFRNRLRRVLDLPAYWLLLLPIEFPATYLAGTIALAVMLRRAAPGAEKTAAMVFAALAADGSLCFMAACQHGRRQQRSGAARGPARRDDSDRRRGCGNSDGVALPRLDRRARAWRACSQPAGYRADA